MSEQLVVVAGPDQGQVFTLTDGQELTIGRGQASDTRLRDPRVSRKHCQIEIDQGRILVKDLGSTVGTFVNGKQVSQQELRPGDTIRVGDTHLRLQSEDAAEESTLYAPVASPKPPAAHEADQLGELVGKTVSHYAIGDIVSKGRTGVVFRARDTEKDRAVALKVLWPAFCQDEEAMRRFIRAMKTMLNIRHPNLVSLYGAGKSGRYYWTAMEFVDGESLTQVIRRIGTAGMLDWQYALRVATHVGLALEAAHEHKIVHRGISPANILVRKEDKLAKLADLMLAKAMEGTMVEEISQAGQIVGDILYMSPEATRGSTEIDCRSDIYSLGATVYALLTGRPPFEGDSLAEIVPQIRDAEPDRPKKFQLSIPDLFEGTVLRMLAKRPEDRFATPTELLADLNRVAQYEGVTI